MEWVHSKVRKFHTSKGLFVFLISNTYKGDYNAMSFKINYHSLFAGIGFQVTWLHVHLYMDEKLNLHNEIDSLHFK